MDPMRKAYRELNADEKALINRIKDDAGELWKLLDAQPSSRELALAKTKLEEAVMWAVKALT